MTKRIISKRSTRNQHFVLVKMDNGFTLKLNAKTLPETCEESFSELHLAFTPLQQVGWRILIRDPTGKWTGGPLEPWFESLRNKAGLYCCAKADGHPLDEDEWDTKGNSYRVFLQGEWTVVPDDTIISGPNKLGKAIVWFQNPGELPWGGNTRTPILCFIPGSGV